jgi:hypothetical protein
VRVPSVDGGPDPCDSVRAYGLGLGPWWSGDCFVGLVLSFDVRRKAVWSTATSP